MTEKIYIRKDRWKGPEGESLPYPWIIGMGFPDYRWEESDHEPYATQQEALKAALGEVYGD